MMLSEIIEKLQPAKMNSMAASKVPNLLLQICKNKKKILLLGIVMRQLQVLQGHGLAMIKSKFN